MASAIVAGWFDEHVSTIHRFAARRIGEHAAWDITADTFRIALEQFNDFDACRGHERAWLFGIASNLLRRHWRTEQRRLHAYLRSTSPADLAGDPLVAVDSRIDAERDIERVVNAIDRLDPDDRELLFLIVWDQLSSIEVSQVMNIPAGTVRSRLKRIRTDLRRQQGETE